MMGLDEMDEFYRTIQHSDILTLQKEEILGDLIEKRRLFEDPLLYLKERREVETKIVKLERKVRKISTFYRKPKSRISNDKHQEMLGEYLEGIDQ